MSEFAAILGAVGMGMMVTAGVIYAISTGGLLGLFILGAIFLGIGTIILEVMG